MQNGFFCKARLCLVSHSADAAPSAVSLGIADAIKGMPDLQAVIPDGVAWLDRWAVRQGAPDFLFRSTKSGRNARLRRRWRQTMTLEGNLCRWSDFMRVHFIILSPSLRPLFPIPGRHSLMALAILLGRRNVAPGPAVWSSRSS
jgi:hypothetical protein